MWADECDDLAEASALSAGVVARWRQLADILDDAARREGLDPDEVVAFAFVESRFSTTAHSGAGARGVMQIMPETGQFLAKKLGIQNFDPWNAAQNIRVGAYYIAALRRRWAGRPVEWARASYYAGPGNVAKFGPGKYSNYTDAIARAVRAVAATRDRCEHSGGGIVPVWRDSPSPSPRPRPGPRPSPRPKPSPAGGGFVGSYVLALALLAALGVGRG